MRIFCLRVDSQLIENGVFAASELRTVDVHTFPTLNKVVGAAQMSIFYDKNLVHEISRYNSTA